MLKKEEIEIGDILSLENSTLCVDVVTNKNDYGYIYDAYWWNGDIQKNKFSSYGFAECRDVNKITKEELISLAKRLVEKRKLEAYEYEQSINKWIDNITKLD